MGSITDVDGDSDGVMESDVNVIIELDITEAMKCKKEIILDKSTRRLTQPSC